MTGCTDEITHQQLAIVILMDGGSEVAWQLWHMQLKANDAVQDTCCSGSANAALASPEAVVQNRHMKAEQAVTDTAGYLEWLAACCCWWSAVPCWWHRSGLGL